MKFYLAREKDVLKIPVQDHINPNKNFSCMNKKDSISEMPLGEPCKM